MKKRRAEALLLVSLIVFIDFDSENYTNCHRNESKCNANHCNRRQACHSKHTTDDRKYCHPHEHNTHGFHSFNTHNNTSKYIISHKGACCFRELTFRINLRVSTRQIDHTE